MTKALARYDDRTERRCGEREKTTCDEQIIYREKHFRILYASTLFVRLNSYVVNIDIKKNFSSQK